MNVENKWEIVDSHLHFWKLSRQDYGWLKPYLGVLYQDCLPNDWQKEKTPIEVNKVVVVQAAPTDAETDYLLSLTQQSDSLAGVVGWVDMLAPSAVACRRLQLLAANPAFKGIRPMLQDIENVEWILNPHFTPIFQFLVANNLSFDALVQSAHLEAILTIARRFPDLNIVINHGAKPNIHGNEFDSWAESISRFSDLTNVFVKVSGLSTEAGNKQQSAQHYRRYFEHIAAVFSVERMMWGSDWPVVNINNSYKGWFELCSELVGAWSPTDQGRFWSGTASEFYRLNEE
ncbi:amidohydrolase family protein [Paraglaciecola arctica]|uniref:amidohydrolase family protein n=1 Tax=Paraglaciecola arctica TaxID=1128911 RepID=UPI001C06DFB5|nr:amidohydrolase family protein [Paraglaciecola arctica]MBU3003877.1 amidohydrolase family protein [Paraglaciecola arctica]